MYVAIIGGTMELVVNEQKNVQVMVGLKDVLYDPK